MRKLFMLALVALLGTQTMTAQNKETEFGIANHLGLGVSLGTDGIGIDLATPFTDYLALRAGVSFWPKLSYSTNIDIDDDNPAIEPNVDLEGKLNIFNGKVLADVYPFKGHAFHLTVGAYFGNGDIVNASNTSMFIKDPAKYGKLGLMLGERRITTDNQGYISADVKVNSFKPYVGFGFGRAVPKKGRVSVSGDFGVQFWGKPQLGAQVKDDWDNTYYHRFKSSELDEYDDADLKDGLELAEKIIVFPVLNIRISGRLF